MNRRILTALMVLFSSRTFSIGLLNRELAPTNELHVSKWPGASNDRRWIVSDPDRFYIEISMHARSNPVVVTVEDKTANPVIFGPIPYRRPLLPSLKDPDKLVSRPLLLVSDAVDHEFIDEQSIPVQLGDTVRFQQGDTITTAKVPVQKTVELRLLSLMNETIPPTSETFLKREVEIAASRLSQCGIAIMASYKSIKVPASFSYGESLIVNATPGEPTTPEKAILDLDPNPKHRSISIFYVNQIAYELEGKAFPIHGIAYPLVLYPQRKNGAFRYANKILISQANHSSLTLAHELGHLLGNSEEHSDHPTNLMNFPNKEILAEGTKRLSHAQCQRFLDSPLLVAPKA